MRRNSREQRFSASNTTRDEWGSDCEGRTAHATKTPPIATSDEPETYLAPLSWCLAAVSGLLWRHRSSHESSCSFFPFFFASLERKFIAHRSRHSKQCIGVMSAAPQPWSPMRAIRRTLHTFT